MKKKLLLAFAPFFISSCAELNSALESVNKTIEGISTPLPGKAKSVSGEKICNDFRENEIVAKRKWIGSYISVKGKVDDVYQSAWGKSVVDFSSNNRVRLSASLNDTNLAGKTKAGNVITVKGVVRSVINTGHCNINLDNAYF